MSVEQECGDESLKASPESVPWLGRLALTRSTVIMPMTNSIGYYNTVRCDVYWGNEVVRRHEGASVFKSYWCLVSAWYSTLISSCLRLALETFF